MVLLYTAQLLDTEVQEHFGAGSARQRAWSYTSHQEGLGGAVHRCSVADEDDTGDLSGRCKGPRQTRLGWETGWSPPWSLSQTTKEA